MKFVRAIWKLLVGIKDALVLIFMLLFFAGLYGVLSAKPPAVGTAARRRDRDRRQVPRERRAEVRLQVPRGRGHDRRAAELHSRLAVLDDDLEVLSR